MTCPQCEYNRKRAQLWRHEAYNEAYKLAGHPLDWEPELVVRREWAGLTDEERKQFEQWMHPDVLENVERLLKERNHDA